MDAIIGMFVLPKDVQLQKYDSINFSTWGCGYGCGLAPHRLSAGALSTLEDIKTQTRAGLEHAVENRKVRVQDESTSLHYRLCATAVRCGYHCEVPVPGSASEWHDARVSSK